MLVLMPPSEGGWRWFDSSLGNYEFAPEDSVLVLMPPFEGGRRWFDSSLRNLLDCLARFNGEAAGF